MNLHKYDNEVQPNNKFGHILDLMKRNAGKAASGAIHLDIACGFGHIAEPIGDLFGLTYVGVDIEDEFIKGLLDRGHEGHVADLESPDLTARLREIVAGRPIASITFMDGLEHLREGAHALGAIGELLAEHRALAYTSVPNVTHMDIVLKQVVGRWDYTEAGLLDHTHYTLYSEASLLEAMGRAGLGRIDAHDVVINKSDQHFPADYAGLVEGTSLSAFLRGVRDAAEPNGFVNQFVWTLAPVPPRVPVVADDVDAPFLSIIMRTQGRRQQELREALLSLAAQSCQDFEVLVVAHRTTYEEQVVVERVIADQPESLSSRIRLLLLDTGQRSAPLNHGIDEARGEYLSIFDDDDIVFANWVEDFKRAAAAKPGRLLRSVALRQETTVVDVLGAAGVRSISAPKPVYETSFSLLKHIAANQSPPIGWVFPATLCRDFGLRFDDSMTTMEDWDFLVRAVQLVGVHDTMKVGAVYRWWTGRDSSRTDHPKDEWHQNENEIARRIDARPLLLPAGETRRIRTDMRRLAQLERTVKRQARLIKELESGRGGSSSLGGLAKHKARRLRSKSLTALRNPALVRERVKGRLSRR